MSLHRNRILTKTRTLSHSSLDLCQGTFFFGGGYYECVFFFKLVYFFACSLLLYREATKFCMLILDPAILFSVDLNKSFLVAFSGSLT